MLVISTRDFRANQTKFLEMANDGESVILKTRGTGSFRIVPVKEDDTVLGKRDLVEELKGALQQVKGHMNGKIKLKTLDELVNEL